MLTSKFYYGANNSFISYWSNSYFICKLKDKVYGVCNFETGERGDWGWR